jgi:hypothetical protein
MSGRAKNLASRIRLWRSPSTVDHPPAPPSRPRRSIREALTDVLGKDAFDKASSPSTQMSVALGQKQVYAGTVAKATIAKRRAANKRARAARSMHRRAAR